MSAPLSPAADLARRHWRKRWAAPGRVDRWMGGRGIGEDNRRALGAILALQPRSMLEIGPGCYRLAAAALAAGLPVAAVEVPIPRVAAFRPLSVATWFAWRAAPLPWPPGHFDVAYQRNAVPNMPAADVPAALDELRRVARLLLWSGDLRPRFWDGGRRTGGWRAGWMRAEIDRRFEVEDLGRKLLLLRPRASP